MRGTEVQRGRIAAGRLKPHQSCKLNFSGCSVKSSRSVPIDLDFA